MYFNKQKEQFIQIYLVIFLESQIFVFKFLSTYLGDQLTCINLTKWPSIYQRYT